MTVNPFEIDLSKVGSGVEIQLTDKEASSRGFVATAEQYASMPDKINGGNAKSSYNPVRSIVINCGDVGIVTMIVYAHSVAFARES